MTKRALLILPLLAACAQPDPADTAGLLADTLATHQASIAGLAPRAPATGGDAAGAASARPASRAATPLDGPPSMAGQLIGQPPEAVTRMLGEPRLRRTEGGAEVWHYQAAQCHLDLVLYPEDGATPALRVAFAAARAVGTARRAEAACLRDIARGAAGRATPAEEMREQAEAGA